MNKLSSSSKHGMSQRLITGTVIVCTLGPCIFFGNWAFFILFAIFAVVGIHEILKAPGPRKYNWLVQLVVYAFVLSFIYWIFLKDYWGVEGSPIYGGTGFYLDTIYISVIAMVMYLFVLFLIAIASPKVQLSDVTYLFSIGVFFALGFQGMYFLRYFANGAGIYGNLTEVTTSFTETPITGSEYFLNYYQAYGLNQSWASCLTFCFVLIGTWMADVGAYFFGVFFGKHRMNPRISPHKTWEGFFGGVIVSVGCSLGMAAIMEYCFNMPLIPGILQFQHSDLLEAMGVMGGTAWPIIVICAVLMPFVGNIGGFLFSLIKRQFGIKDFGNLFPGHGGVIDRFDSVMSNAVVIACIIVMTAGGWKLLV